MKRFVCVLLAVLLVVCLLPTAAFAAGEEHKVFRITASGSEFVNEGGSYKTTLSKAEVYDDYGEKRNLAVTATALYTSSTLSSATKLTTEPQVGTTYYFAIRVRLGEKETGKIYGYDAAGIRSRSTVTIDGYDVKNESVKEGDGGVYVQLICSATKKASPVKITGLKVTGNSYEFIANSCHIADHSATLVTEKGELEDNSYKALCTDAECEKALKTAPEAGKTYYMYFKFIANNVYYKDAITAANTSIDVKGFTDAKIVKTDIGASSIYVYISLKYADTTAAKPKLTSIAFYSDGIRQDSSFGTYFPADPSLYTSSDMGRVDMNEEISCFYTDSACSQQLKTAPAVGKTYYFTITLNHEAGAFENAITIADSSIEMTGFADSKLVSVKSNGDRGVLVLCSGKYIGDQKGKLLGVELTATGLRHDTDLGVYFPSISKLLCKTDLGSIKLGYTISRLHHNSACTQDLKTAPEDGQTYYFTITLKHAEGEYENAIKNSNSSVKITGFSDCKVVETEIDPKYGTRVYFSVTYGMSAKPPVETTAPATKPTEPPESIAATEPTDPTEPTETTVATEPTEDGGNSGNQGDDVTKPVAGQRSQEDSGMPWWGLLIIVTVACLILGGAAIAITIILKKGKDK